MKELKQKKVKDRKCFFEKISLSCLVSATLNSFKLKFLNYEKI